MSKKPILTPQEKFARSLSDKELVLFIFGEAQRRPGTNVKWMNDVYRLLDACRIELKRRKNTA